MSRVGLQIDAVARRCEISILDAIGSGLFGDGVTAKEVDEALRRAEGAQILDVTLSSPGGDVWEGLAIYNALLRFPAAQKTVRVDGIAASIASVIMLAADRRIVARNARVMIHEARTFSGGIAKDMRKLAERLEETNELMAQTYAERTGQPKDELLKLMAEETWFTAAEAKDRGFATEVTDSGGRVTAHAGHRLFACYGRAPEDLLRAAPPTPPVPPVSSPAELRLQARVAELERQELARDREQVIQMAQAERKLTPAMAHVAREMPIALLRRWVAAAPSIIDTRRVRDPEAGELPPEALVTDLERRLIAQHQINADEYARHKASLVRSGRLPA